MNQNTPPQRGFTSKDAYVDMAQLLPTARVIFDVGANAGYTVARFRRLFADATVHAFEPASEEFAQLCGRWGNDNQVRPVRAALSDTAGSATLFVNSLSVTSALSPLIPSSAPYLPEGLRESAQEAVPVRTIDQYVSETGIDRIDILKMDAQGSELNILKGARETLNQRRVGLVYSELMFVPVYEQQATFYDIASLLAGHGYDLYDFYGFTHDRSGQLKWGDAIFLPRS